MSKTNDTSLSRGRCNPLGASPARGGGDVRDGKPVGRSGRDDAGRSKPPPPPGATPPRRHASDAGVRARPGCRSASVAAAAPAPTRRRATPATGTAPAAGAGDRRHAARRELIGEKDFNTCKKFPAGKRIVKLNLKPDTELGDLDRVDLVDHVQAVPAARNHPGQQQEGHGRRARADHARGGVPAVPGRARVGRD